MAAPPVGSDSKQWNRTLVGQPGFVANGVADLGATSDSAGSCLVVLDVGLSRVERLCTDTS